MAKSPARKPTVNRKWFETKIADSAYTQTEIATRIGINKAGFSRMLSGDQQMTTEAASVLANLLDESIIEVLKQADALSPGVSAARLETLSGSRAAGADVVVGERAATVYKHPSLGEITAAEDAENRRLPRADIVGWIDEEGIIHNRGVDSPTRVSSPIRLPTETVAYRFQTNNEWDRWIVYANMDPEIEGVSTAALGQLCIVRCNNESNKATMMLRHLLRKIDDENYLIKPITCNNKSNKATPALLKKAWPVLWMRQR